MSAHLPEVRVGEVIVDGTQPLFILGPCVIESEAFVRDMAQRLKVIADELNLRWVFKASYDKANRTSINSYRGMDCADGCKILGEIGAEIGVPVTTDVHSVEEAETAAEHIDLLQIPAFLCRQTDLIVAAGQTGRAVNVKKGQFLAPWDMKNIAEKLLSVGCENFLFTERGTTFGYNNLVADMRSLYWMRELGVRVIFDATHSVQRPGGQGGTTGGDGVLAPVLARAAVATGVDGVFIETHIDPSKALSDGPNQIPLAQLPALLRQLSQLHTLVHAPA
jgi:2-dehydro-3-deoxyphosphooctonate aldolase (KDO 8-P synthase)